MIVHGSPIQQQLGQGEVGRFRHSVLCIWWLSWLAIEMPWLALAGPFLSFLVQNWHRNHSSDLVGALLLAL